MAAIRAVKTCGSHAAMRAHASNGNFIQNLKRQFFQAKSLPPHLFQVVKENIVEKSVATDKMHPVKELHKALLSEENLRAKELFSKVVERDENTQYDLTSLYHNLKSDPKSKEICKNFKKLYCEHVIEEAVRQSDHRLLQSSLAEQCRDTSRDQLVGTLEAMKDPRATRFARVVESIDKIPHEKHKLKPIDSFEISVAAEKKLIHLSNRTKLVYRTGDQLHTSRACVLDPVRRTFTILSKSHGKLNAEGAFKRVSDAIEVRLGKTSAAARPIAHVRNKADEYIPTSELKYEIEFGNIIGWTRYNSKNRPYEKKTLILQEAYDHDLYVFTGFTSEEKRKKMSLGDMIQVLEAAGKTLLEMHERGIAHRDVKAKNILYKKEANGKVSAKLIDYGHCYIPDQEAYLRKRTKGYGTLRYTAPDLLEDPSMRGDPVFMGKAEDAYALGQCIYEVYLGRATPWGSITYRALKRKKNADENRATAIRLQKEEAAYFAKEAAKGPRTAEKDLLGIMARLLEPNPKKRMKMPEFMSALYDLKAKYATLSTVEKN